MVSWSREATAVSFWGLDTLLWSGEEVKYRRHRDDEEIVDSGLNSLRTNEEQVGVEIVVGLLVVATSRLLALLRRILRRLFFEQTRHDVAWLISTIDMIDVDEIASKRRVLIDEDDDDEEVADTHLNSVLTVVR